MSVDPHNQRFRRQVILPELGIEGQTRLASAKVLVIGAGGLGCPAIQYLASSGVGEIGVVDADSVEESNLARQVLFGAANIGQLKVEVVREIIQERYPDIVVHSYPEMLSKSNASSLLSEFDMVLDCTDDYSVSYILSDETAMNNQPLIYGALHRYEGQLAVFNYQGGGDFRQLFPEQEALEQIPTCTELGVLSSLPGIIGVMQATEAIKIITDIGEVMSGKLLIYNSLNNQISKTVF